jgi:hypothetical protein
MKKLLTTPPFGHPFNLLKENVMLFCLLLSAFCLLPGTLSAQIIEEPPAPIIKELPARQTEMFRGSPRSAALLSQAFHGQQKVFREKFIVHPKDKIVIDTDNVKIMVEEHEKNEIVFITTVMLSKSTKEDMENLIKALQMSNKQSGKTITYNLNIDWSGKAKTNNLAGLTEITLKIYAPKDVVYDIKARRGDVEMESVRNDFNATITYGNLRAEDLLGNKNNIDIRYGNLTMEDLHGNFNNVVIRYGKFKIFKAEHLDLDIGYAQGEINNAGLLKLDSKYCTVKLGSVKSLAFDSGYDQISIQNQIEKINGEMKYGTLTVNSLKISCILPVFAYSKITINKVLKSFTDINISASNSNIKLNIPKDQSFAFEFSGRYTDFKDKNAKWNHTIFEEGSNSLQMSSTFGKDSNSGKSVKINARYGSVSLFGR